MYNFRALHNAKLIIRPRYRRALKFLVEKSAVKYALASARLIFAQNFGTLQIDTFPGCGRPWQ